ncbi:MAG: hypothetical protein D3924_08805, partial [Candidatus Electrothrix sp. AR4]|nr:hypothetical protein [Candidatus Electrothrix sp. AR4]
MQTQKNTAALYRQVRIKDIDLTDTSYALHPFPLEPDSELLRSVTRLGMLHPPLLLEDSGSKFIVLSGRRRLQVVQSLAEQNNFSSITALIVPYSSNDLHVFSMLLQHRQIGGKLSIIEQAVFLQKAMEVLKLQEVLDLLPMLGLKAKPHIPEQLIALLELDASVQLGLHRGVISQRSGNKLARFSVADQKKLTEIIDLYQLTGSKQQKLIDQFFQLTKRQRVPAKELFEGWCTREKDT